MSDAVSALGGTQANGPVAHVEEAPLQGMVTLRGDLGDPALLAAVQTQTGCPVPGLRRLERDADRAVAWMSPDELLLLVPFAEASAVVRELGVALSAVHHLVADVSDARAMFRIGGPGAREALARLCPVDLSPAAFAPGEVRRTRLAQVPAAFWVDDGGSFSLICFRSVARYVFDVLAGAVAGDHVGFFPHS